MLSKVRDTVWLLSKLPRLFIALLVAGLVVGSIQNPVVGFLVLLFLAVSFLIAYGLWSVLAKHGQTKCLSCGHVMHWTAYECKNCGLRNPFVKRPR